MADLFSAEWMAGFQNAWNAEPDLSGELAKIGFNSNIGYGFKGEDAPRGVLVVENGVATGAGAYAGQPLNWDLRADAATWQGWMTKPPGMMGLGMAYTSKKLQFAVGDYAAMVKDPRMAGPFMKSFSVMARV
ncbi:hypothetical protein GGD81_003492 [Rhodobium orientis]|uniref:SCP-2 sterol transfer family protein n=1 Tax=Rhodobium orientis TaxID=34017 RepID=A0A327JL68_9HYPH|nr:SCP-2 sterol transfer family protein [Rhodobium orientis]MBB4304433.1 hypothetical protein [Rhodobium orientis]MBK5949958.1 SCP-2 sterol transfer family protein [Rhodobium orientis]RAI25582.1 SCP-2 sterol transfer family protein [Rhodobium orientis]